MKGEKLGTWTESWVPRLWKGWVACAIFTIGVVLVLLQVLKDTPVSEDTLALLRNPPPWSLWLILLPSVLIIFGLAAAFARLLQVWDDRRIGEAEKQLKAFADEKADLEIGKNKIEKELHLKTSLLENLKEELEVSERLRRRDPITGIPNYFAFSYDYREWIKAGRISNLCLILIDIDKLKWLNGRNRECADKVLKYFAQSTMNSMRRDEQMYKSETDNWVHNFDVDERKETDNWVYNSEVDERKETDNWVYSSEVDERKDNSEAKMYRHYQGGDEFIFIITGSVFDAIGFINRLRDKVKGRSYQAQIRSKILNRYLVEEDANSFQLTFSAAVFGPGKWSFPDAYMVLERAKHSPKSRLMVVFDSTYEEPSTYRAELEEARENVQNNLADFQQRIDSGDERSKEKREALLEEASRLDTNIMVLKKAEQIFSV